VDTFLEHSRIYVFCHGGENKFYISSGDWMYRNLDFRSEVTTPVYDEDIQQELRRYLSIQLRDNCKARLLNMAGEENAYVKSGRKTVVRSQKEIYKWLSTKHFAESRFKTFLQNVHDKQKINMPVSTNGQSKHNKLKANRTGINAE
jgi:polyphosphate kinase